MFSALTSQPQRFERSHGSACSAIEQMRPRKPLQRNATTSQESRYEP